MQKVKSKCILWIYRSYWEERKKHVTALSHMMTLSWSSECVSIIEFHSPSAAWYAKFTHIHVKNYLVVVVFFSSLKFVEMQLTMFRVKCVAAVFKLCRITVALLHVAFTFPRMDSALQEINSRCELAKHARKHRFGFLFILHFRCRVVVVVIVVQCIQLSIKWTTPSIWNNNGAKI